MDPMLITAWVTVAIAASTVVGGDVTCSLIWRGLRAMDCSSDEWARDREVAAEELKAWRDDMKAWDEEDIWRHKEAMGRIQSLHDQSMTALRALIRRTGPAAAE
ncbi:MAG: hypothetical protein OXF26_13725 [Alphaproteobacteria bacterium]|nr:hypothetical protein [Alphaproteobacteria bacterium]